MSVFDAALKNERERVNDALRSHVAALPAPVREAAEYAVLGGGKRLRPMLLMTMARAFGYGKADIYRMAAVPELFHVASLLHDDILDASDTRRGRQSAHLRFGVNTSVLTGDALLAEACHVLADYGNPRMVSSIAEALVHTTGGEIAELSLAGRLLDGLDEYYEVIEGKTAWLLRSSCELGAMLAGASDAETEAAGQYGLNLGYAFQIVDDALDFADNTGKPVGGDLRERKSTPPILLYAESLDASQRAAFAEKFSGSGFSGQEADAVIEAIRSGGFAEKARDLADVFLEKASLSLKKIPNGTAKIMLKEALAYARGRKN